MEPYSKKPEISLSCWKVFTGPMNEVETTANMDKWLEAYQARKAIPATTHVTEACRSIDVSWFRDCFQNSSLQTSV